MQQPIVNASQLFEFLKKKYQDLFESVEIELDEVCVLLQANQLIKFISSLRDDPMLQFSQLMDVTAVDYPEREVRFEIVYQFLSIENNLRLRVKLPLNESDAVPSLISYYKSANWFEREVWDMFGIPFENHPDLRRILSDYGFRGHPLRKDFPLTGYVEMRYDSSQAKVVYEPVKLVQDFRNFDFLSPWEAMTGAGLPGDEKAVAQKSANGGA